MESDTSKILRDKKCFTIAITYSQNIVIGGCTYKNHSNKFIELKLLGVKYHYQGKHLGSKLIEDLKRRA